MILLKHINVHKSRRKKMLMTDEELPKVAVESMNDTHLEDLIIINQLAHLIEEGDVDAITEKLDAFIIHTIEHFSVEEKMMREKEFPAYPMHKTEHDRALAELKETVSNWKAHKDLKALRYYIVTVMPSWLVQHVSTMDTVTARFLVSK